jgi:hypothetical protein
MRKLLTRKNERGNNIIFVLAGISVLVLLFGFSIDAVRFLHVRTTVQLALDRTAVSWLTSYNYATGTVAQRRAIATSAAQIVYRDNISSIENMVECVGPCGAPLNLVSGNSNRVELRTVERMDFVYLNSIVGAGGVSLGAYLNNESRTNSYRSVACLNWEVSCPP